MLPIFSKVQQHCLRPFLDFILPPVCPLCQATLSQAHTICPPCWSRIQFISDPFCDRCALPFEFGMVQEHQKCGGCIENPPLYEQTRACFKYDTHSKKLILSFKHGNALYLAPLLAEWMYRSSKDILSESDLIIPVPLHWTRLLKRGYNQAGVLTQHLSKLSMLPLSLMNLRRHRRTPSQGHFSINQRKKNVLNAFYINNVEKLKNKRIILVDDVLTSGATLEECTKILLKAGAKSVKIIVAAKVVT